MSNPFSEDALIEQPAIRLFKDGLERPSTNFVHECTNMGRHSFIRVVFVDGFLCQTRDLLLPRLVSGEVEVGG